MHTLMILRGTKCSFIHTQNLPTSFFLDLEFSSAPFFETRSVCAVPLIWESKFHTLVKNRQSYSVAYRNICTSGGTVHRMLLREFIKKRMRWAWPVAWVWKLRNVYETLVWKPQEKILLRKRVCWWENKILICMLKRWDYTIYLIVQKEMKRAVLKI
jgi:hypothetical protein